MLHQKYFIERLRNSNKPVVLGMHSSDLYPDSHQKFHSVDLDQNSKYQLYHQFQLLQVSLLFDGYYICHVQFDSEKYNHVHKKKQTKTTTTKQ